MRPARLRRLMITSVCDQPIGCIYNCNYMGQVTIYLDDQTETLLKRHIRKSGESASRWVAEAVRRRVGKEWPPDVLELLGSWKAEDFPDAADLRTGYGPDAMREQL